MNNMYFIVGCGRSGTNWLAQIIDQHPDVFSTIEHPDIFPIVTECALDPTNKRERLKPVFDLYRKHASENKIYLDKSHPNLWHIDLIREEFPEAKFIGIQRDVYGVVSSMLQHGCADWGNRWKEFPLPNKFLGITEAAKDVYEDLTLMEKCVWRWCSHNRELQRQCLVQWSSDRNHYYLAYDRLLWDHAVSIHAIANFMGISLLPGMPQRQNEYKWVDSLTSEDCFKIKIEQEVYRRYNVLTEQ
jgi:hypothetical protein